MPSHALPRSERPWPVVRTAFVAGAAGLLAAGMFSLALTGLPRQQREVSHVIRRTVAIATGVAALEGDLATAMSDAARFGVAATDAGVAKLTADLREVSAELAAVRALATDDPRQYPILDRLDRSVGLQSESFRELAAMQQSRGELQAMDPFDAHVGSRLADRVAGELRDLNAAEQRLLSLREQAAQRALRWTIATLVGCAMVVSGCAALLAAALVARGRTRRHLVRTELERDRFGAAVQASGLLWTNDATGRMTGRQPGWAALTGQDEAEYQGYGWSKAIHPDDVQPTMEAWERAVVERRIFVFEHRLRRHDGVWRRFALRAVPLFEGDGAIREWVGVHTDITERREAEQALAQHHDDLQRQVEQGTAELVHSEARFRLLAEYASDMISRIELDGTRSYASPAALTMFGVSPEVLMTRGVLHMIHPEDRAAVAAMQTRLQTGLAEQDGLSFRILNPTRGEVWAEVSGRALRHPETGQADGYVSVLRDVTERKKLEEQLRHTQRMEAIGRIAAGVAHDFNNILQSVCGGLELILDDVEPHMPAHDYIHTALGAARRGAHLTHHLLSYVRKQVLRPQVIALMPFLADMHRLLGRTLGPHIRVEVPAFPDALAIYVDPNQLETALLNLAINAAHAMPRAGELTLGARAAMTEGFEQRVVVWVRDTGTGMDEATAAQACEPFFTTKGLDGTGLGLSMVQGFAAQSGGDMRIASALGSGTTIELWLPPAGQAADPPEEPAKKAEPTGMVGSVLLVDDDPDVLMTLRASLEWAGLRVVQAGSGEEALSILASRSAEQFDVLVTDYAMPSLNGVDLALRGRLLQPGLPVVIITGFAEIRPQGEALPETVRVLHKPFQREALLEAVQTASNGKLEKLATAQQSPSA